MDVLLKENLSGENHEGKQTNTPLRYLTTTSILGDKVYNRNEEKLGEIMDIMMDLKEGKVKYFVIEFGGFLGIGEKYFAIPFNLLQVDPEKGSFIFDQKKDVLEHAPGFDKERWPATNSHEVENSFGYWGSFMGANTGGKY